MDGKTIAGLHSEEGWTLDYLADQIDAALAAEREADCAAIRAACTMCNGTGGEDIPGGRVTRDMALDAGCSLL